MNQITIIGRAGRDAELRYTLDGTAVASFSLAVRDGKDKATGEERTMWFRVSCWRGLAEIAHQYVTKGKQVAVIGSVSARLYDDRDGKPAVSLEVTADRLELLGGGGADSSGRDAQTVARTDDPGTITPDDLPF